MTTEFENFLARVAMVDNVRDGSTLDADREKLKADPVTAWALATLSAQGMKKHEDSSGTKEWLQAEMLWRPITEIVEEMKAEKEKEDRLQHTPSREDKARARQREANDAFKKMSGTPVDNPDPIKLAIMIGPGNGLTEKLGERNAINAIAALASSKDINLLLPICEAFVNGRKLFETPCQKYLAWETRRDFLAKGEKKMFGLVTKVNKEELKRANDAMAALEAKDPLVRKMLIFRKMSAEALAHHDKKPADPTSMSEMTDLWQQIIDANKDMAKYTLKVRDQKKQEQLDQGAGVDKIGQQNSLGKRDSKSNEFNKNAPIPLDEGRPIGKGSLLTDEDVNLIKKKDKAKKPGK
jgi:hypothetical protein